MRTRISSVIEDVLKSECISFKGFPVRGGFDVEATSGYAVRLPQKITLQELSAKVDQGYFTNKERDARPDLCKPSTLTDDVAIYIVSLPEELQTKYDFLEVARIKVIKVEGDVRRDLLDYPVLKRLLDLARNIKMRYMVRL